MASSEITNLKMHTKKELTLLVKCLKRSQLDLQSLMIKQLSQESKLSSMVTQSMLPLKEHRLELEAYQKLRIRVTTDSQEKPWSSNRMFLPLMTTYIRRDNRELSLRK
jgi:hypothetical protein